MDLRLISKIFVIASTLLNTAFAQNSEMIWSKTYGGSERDEALCVRATLDGGLIVAGSSWSFNGDVSANHGETDVWILKLNADGDLEWERSYGGSDLDNVSQIEVTEDGGYLLIGFTASSDGDVMGYHGMTDGWVLKLDSEGIIEWQRCYGGSNIDGIHSFAFGDNNTYVFLGSSMSIDGDLFNNTNHGLRDVWLFRTDINGNILSSYLYGSSDYDAGVSISKGDNGSFMLLCEAGGGDGDVSNSNYHPNSKDYWVLMIDTLGQIQYSRCFGGASLEDPRSIINTSDGGYILIGGSFSNDGDVTDHHESASMPILPDCWIVKLNGEGSLMWSKSFGGTNYEICSSIIEVSDGFFFASTTESSDGDVILKHGFYTEGWLVKIDHSGQILWQNSYGGSFEDGIGSIIHLTDGSYVCGGGSRSSDYDVPENKGESDLWIFKLASNTLIDDPVSEPAMLAFPNPASDWLHFQNILNEKVTLTLTDGLGHVLLSRKLNREEIFAPDISGFPKGMYFLMVTNESGIAVHTQKLIIN